MLLFSTIFNSCLHIGWLGFKRLNISYHISSYKALPWIIPATLIIPAILTILCSRNVVFSNKTRIWRLCKIIIPAGLIWGNTVCIVSPCHLVSVSINDLQLVTQVQLYETSYRYSNILKLRNLNWNYFWPEPGKKGE